MGQPLENDDVAKEVWQNLADATALSTEEKTALRAQIDAASAAQGALADSAVQPADLAAHAADTDPHGDRAYADSLVVGLLDDRGNYNASGNVFPSTGGSGTAGAILKGDLWTISVAGTLGGVAVTAGDVLRSLVDTPGQTAGNWVITENNLGYVPENSANKSSDVNTDQASTTKYPTVKALYDWAIALFATITGTQTLTNKTLTNPTVSNYTEAVVSIGTVTTTHTLVLTNGTRQRVRLTASTACTFTMPTPTDGKSFLLEVEQAATTGNGTATFTSVDYGSNGTPTVTTTAGKMDIFTFMANGSKWYGQVAKGYTY